MINCLKSEIKYIFASKIVISMLLVMVLAFSLILFMNYQSVIDSYYEYNATLEYYKENSLDIMEALTDDFSIETDGLSATINNPLAYHKNILGQYIFAASKGYTASQLLESCLILFPLICVVFGLCISTYDDKYKTIKLKGVRFTRSDYAMSKQLALTASFFVLFITSLLIGILLGAIVSELLKNNVPIGEYVVIYEKKHFAPKMLFAFIFGLTFAEIGFFLGLIFRNLIVGTILVAGYTYLLPILNKFDFKNAYYSLAVNVYDFYGVVSLREYINVPNAYGISFMTIVLTMSIGLSVLIVHKRSMYE